MTQAELAGRCDVAQATIAMVERDALAPAPELLAKLSAVTSFPPEFFPARRSGTFRSGRSLTGSSAR